MQLAALEGFNMFICCESFKTCDIPYILECNPHQFLPISNMKKKLVRGSNPHLSFNRPLSARQTDSFMNDDGDSDE